MEYSQHLRSRPFRELAYRLTRAELIDIGALVAVPEHIAREAGITVPVALTRAAWEDCVAWTGIDEDRTGAVQDEGGRLWDVVWMTAATVRNAVPGHRRHIVPVYRVSRYDGVEPKLIELVAAVGPGDEGEPVMTIKQLREE